MKISELIKRLQEIRLEYGNLDVYLEVHFDADDQQGNSLKAIVSGEVTDMYSEERTTLFLVSEED